MHQASPEKHRKIVAAVVGSAAKLPKTVRGALRGPKLEAYLRGYYANVDAEDLAGRAPAELATIALSHFSLAHRRRGRALVRVLNPTLRADGYTSPHTVIEMVNDDMPFLVDSIGLALTQRSLTLHFLAHPIFAVIRDGAGGLQSLQERGESIDGKKQRLESFQHIEVDRIVDPDVLRALQAQIERSMRDVRVACVDWAKMQHAARQAADDLNALNSRFDPLDVSETQALLEWMQNRHFTFLGYREYRLHGAAGNESRNPAPRPQAPREHQPRSGERHPAAKPLARTCIGHQSEFSVDGA
jgi:glutamate dehydrogenase